MTIIDENTVVVFDSDELKNTIQGAYSYVYFGADITLTSGIKIPANKENLIIDGTYEGVRYTYTDMDSGSATSCIYANATLQVEKQHVTIQNIDVVGRNYYGIIVGHEISGLTNLTITYKNLNYIGTQPSFHPYGTTEFIDVTMQINNTQSSRDGEISECNRIVLGGNVKINHTFTGYHAFSYRGGNNKSFTVLPNANVELTVGRNLFYGTSPEMIFGENSTFILNAPRGVSYDSLSRASSVLIDDNAYVEINRTDSSLANWYINEALTINNGASLIMKQNYANSVPIIYFYVTGANLNINNPKKVVFLNSSSYLFYFTGTTNFNISGGQVNQWNAAGDGSIQDLPTYSWQKNDNSLILLTGTLTNSTTAVTSHNLNAEELIANPNLNLLQFRTAKVLSIGPKIPLSIGYLSDISEFATGSTKANIGIKITYGITETFDISTYDGSFNIPVSGLQIGDEITFTVADDYLNNKKTVTVIYPGDINIETVPETIPFSVTDIVRTNPVMLGRNPSDWKMVVYDSRLASSSWKILASINSPLTSRNGYTLPDALVYIDNADVETVLTSTPIEVFRGSNNGGSPSRTDVTWDSDKGILVKMTDTPLQNGEVYKADIQWDLEIIPNP